MLDIQLIRDHPDKVKQAIINKHLPPRVNVEVVDRILELDEKRRLLIKQTEDIRRERNELAERLKTTRSEADKTRGRKLKEKLSEIEPELSRIEDTLQELTLMVP